MKRGTIRTLHESKYVTVIGRCDLYQYIASLFVRLATNFEKWEHMEFESVHQKVRKMAEGKNQGSILACGVLL